MADFQLLETNWWSNKNNYEGSKEKEKQLWKTAVFQRLGFSTRES